MTNLLLAMTWRNKTQSPVDVSNWLYLSGYFSNLKHLPSMHVKFLPYRTDNYRTVPYEVGHLVTLSTYACQILRRMIMQTISRHCHSGRPGNHNHKKITMRA